MTSVGKVESEVVVEGSSGGSGAKHADTTKEELREVVRELLEEMLHHYLRVEEER